MGWDLRVPLLETLVLANPMKIVTSDDNSPPHLRRDANTSHDPSTDRNSSSERAFLINISAILGSGWGLDAQTNVLDVTDSLLALLSCRPLLCCQTQLRLLLICSFSLRVSHLGKAKPNRPKPS